MFFEIHSTHDESGLLYLWQKIKTFYDILIVKSKNTGEKSSNIKVFYLEDQIVNRKNRNNSLFNLNSTLGFNF